MSGSLLGRSIALVLPSGDRLLSACLPAEVDGRLVDALVHCANETISDEGAAPYAVRVVRERHTEQPEHVPAQRALKYRAGRRLLVWREGDFDPDWSFDSTVERVIFPEFPARLHPQVSLEQIGSAATLILHDSDADALIASEWDKLTSCVVEILRFLRETLERSGNEDITWNAAWWRCAASFLDALESNLSDLKDPKVTPSQMAYASAGLPVPDEGERYGRLDARKFESAVRKRWSNATLARETLEWLEAKLGRTPALADLPWSDYPTQLLRAGHTISALTTLGVGSPAHREAWRRTSETEFLGVAQHEEGVLTVSVGGQALVRPDESNIWVFPTDRLAIRPSSSEADRVHVYLDHVEITVPWLPGVEYPNLGQSLQLGGESISVKIRGAGGWDFEVDSRHTTVSDAGVTLTGRVYARFRTGNKWPDRALRVSVDFPESSEVTGYVNREARCRIVIPSPWAPTLIVFWGGGKGKLAVSGGGKVVVRDGRIVGREDESPEAITLQLSRERNGHLLVYDGRDSLGRKAGVSTVFLGDGEVEGGRHHYWPVVDCGEILLADGLRCTALAGSREFELLDVSVEDTSIHPWLPIAATALDVAPERGPPTDNMEASLRGRIEDLMASAVNELVSSGADWQVPPGGLWQSVIPTGDSRRFRPVSLTSDGSVKWFANVPTHRRRLGNAGEGPSEGLLNSASSKRFWSVLRDLAERIESRKLLQKPWPSRWQFIADGQSDIGRLVDEYLEAFSELIVEARTRGSGDQFWATYPFSVFLFDEEREQLVAVALSPLHPVRLGWLYGVEQAVSAANGPERARLIQLAEGWNFPWLGPAPAPAGNPAFLTAVPIDPGPEQLFVGWSMLVRFDNTQGSPLVIPNRAAGLKVPGGSASGLNEGGVGAALRDFLRIYPHLSTLNVDLYASAKGARSTGLDRSVVDELAAILGKDGVRERLPGGIRVFDSFNREGPPPDRDSVIESLVDVHASGPLPISWTRYEPVQDGSPASDLRIVEDAQAQVARVRGEFRGAVPKWPLRRFSVHTLSGDGSTDISVHGAVNPSGPGFWSAFVNALHLVESGSEDLSPGLLIQPRMALRAADASARWVVSGSLHMNPATLARAVAEYSDQAQGGERMLWEWRPAHLTAMNGRGAPRLERRPYTTIATIPPAFQESLKERLGAREDLAREVFVELGRRGVGLASLLAIGGHHSLGALGFFFGFKLLRRVPSGTDGHRVVISMDAADSLLRAAAESGSGDSMKRADLLLVEIRPGAPTQVRFVPIEVKCHGFGSEGPSSSFPDLNSRAVDDALKQLDDSSETLETVVENARAAVTAGDGSLECAALATVIESALFLDGGHVPSQLAANVLQDLASGRSVPAVGRGLLLWFQDTSARDSTVDVSTDIRSEARNRAVVFVDPALDAHDGDWNRAAGALDPAIQDVLDWCLGSEPSEGGSSLGPRTRRDAPAKAEAGENDPDDASRRPQESGDSREAPDTSLPDPDEQSRDETPQSEDLDSDGRQNVLREVERPRVVLGKGNGGMPVEWDPFHPKVRLTNSHVVILGASGAGKTQVTRAFLAELCDQGVSSLVLDFKDDYVDPAFLESLGARLLQADEGLPVNPLALTPDPVTEKVNPLTKVYEVAGVLSKVYRLGDQQEANLRNAIRAAYEDAGVSMNSGEAGFQVVPSFDEVKTKLEEYGDQRLLNRLSPLFDLGLFSGGEDSLLRTLREPTVIRLAHLPTEDVKRATAEIVLMGLYSTLLRMGQAQGIRLSVVVDEAHKIANLDAMKLLLKEARAYGASIILSSQEARDFDETVFSNAGSLLVLKLSETKDSERVAALLGGGDPRALAERIRDLQQFQGFFRNDHHSPRAEVTVIPHYQRISRERPEN